MLVHEKSMLTRGEAMLVREHAMPVRELAMLVRGQAMLVHHLQRPSHVHPWHMTEGSPPIHPFVGREGENRG